MSEDIEEPKESEDTPAAKTSASAKCLKKLETIKTDVEAIAEGPGINKNFPLYNWINPAIKLLTAPGPLDKEQTIALKELIKPLATPECDANTESGLHKNSTYPYNLAAKLLKIIKG